MQKKPSTRCFILVFTLWSSIMMSSVSTEISRTVGSTGGNVKRCLVNHPEVYPKRHVLVKKSVYPFKMEMSERISHQLVTHVFGIFVEEVLGYTDVEIFLKKDHFNATESLLGMSNSMDMGSPSVQDSQPPPTLANLELWMPSEANINALEIYERFKETGIIGPPGRFSWFIPSKHAKLLPSAESYTIFKTPETAKVFSVPPDEMKHIFGDAKPRQIFDKDAKRLNCTSSLVDGCSEGMFTPPWCTENTCALLLTGNPGYQPEYWVEHGKVLGNMKTEEGYHCCFTELKSIIAYQYDKSMEMFPFPPNVTGFVVQHIMDLHLYVNVAFVGKRLDQVVSNVDDLVSNSKSKRSYVVLTWTPSTLVLPLDKRFTTILFPPCELFAGSSGCKYDPHRLVKVVWQQLDKAAKLIHDAIMNLYFTRENYLDLLERYNRRQVGGTVRDAACGWLKDNTDIWDKWRTAEERDLYIGGIFPVSVPEYRATGIITAAEMAIEAVNSRKDLLPGYRLNLILADGKCQADVVMKTFVDYVSSNQHLVGVLGPACSDTVEPIAGVSRYYRTIVISYSAEGSRFSDREKYPYFFRTIGENHQYIYVYQQLLKQLHWNQVASLTQDGTKYAEYISSLQDLLHTSKIMFIVNRKFPAIRDPNAMRKYLTEMKSRTARIIIADISVSAARDMMCQAFKLDMTGAHGFIWFLPLWFSPDWYNTDKYNKILHENISCSTKEMLQAINGHLGVTFAHYASDEKMMEEGKTVGEWKGEYGKVLDAKGREHSDYGGYAYDAVWTFAYALDKLMQSDLSFISNIYTDITLRHFVDFVQQTDFDGVSGRVQFSKQSTRLSEIHVVQWLNNKTNVVGMFHPNSTDPNGGNLFLNESMIKWLTPDGKRPTDGANQCYIQWVVTTLDVPCDRAYIILNVTVFVLLMLIMILIFIFTKRRYDKKVQLSRRYLKSFGTLLNSSNIGLDKWEIPREHVVMNRKLGEGAFGFVYGGEVYFNEKGWIPVAVKTLKIGSTTEEKLDFLSEAEVMKRFDHKNVVKLLGVCRQTEPVYTIMEFMLYGDLKTFLLARRHLVNEKGGGEESEEVSCKKLTSMALDVARALSYLNELKYVHRDVASRNCLVNGSRTVKLGDFGMTRPMFENDYYKFNRKGMLPVRWMAPESLGLGIFTPSSDVWSYGVLLYEITTFGSFPFQGMSNNQVLEYVKSGNVLKVPPKIKPQLEGLMRSCWNRDPKLRPQASEIVEFLANNPRLIVPCLDVPISSVQIEDNGQVQIQIPEKVRKISVSLRNRSNNSLVQRPTLWRTLSSDEESSSIAMDKLDSPAETLPRISEGWNNCNGGHCVTGNNCVNIWANPIDNRLWASNTGLSNSAVEPLLGSTGIENDDNHNIDDDNNKYVPLKPFGTNFTDTTTQEDSYCLHDSSVRQADSVL